MSIVVDDNDVCPDCELEYDDDEDLEEEDKDIIEDD